MFLFVGGEDIDFSSVGNVVVYGSGTYNRPSFSRCSLAVIPYYPSPWGIYPQPNGITGYFSQPSSDFWVSAWVYIVGENTSSQISQTDVISLRNGNVRVLSIDRVKTSGQLRLVKWDGGSAVQLQSQGSLVINQLVRVDVKVKLGASGEIVVFLNGVETLSYSADFSSYANQQIDNISFKSGQSYESTSTYRTHWSEIIVAERDTRTLNLRTLHPESTISSGGWVGTHAEIDELTSDSGSTIAYSATADEIFECGLPSLPSGDWAVRAVTVSAMMSADPEGPHSTQIGISTDGVQHLSPDFAVDSGWLRVSHTFEANSATGNPWTPEDMAAVTMLIKSRP